MNLRGLNSDFLNKQSLYVALFLLNVRQKFENNLDFSA